MEDSSNAGNTSGASASSSSFSRGNVKSRIESFQRLHEETAGQLAKSREQEEESQVGGGAAESSSTSGLAGRFEVPDIENGWEMSFDSDEEESSGSAHSEVTADNSNNNTSNNNNRMSSRQEQQQEEECCGGLSLPPLVDKSACFESSPVTATATRARREVYKMPTHDQSSDNSILLWPVGLLITTISFQFRLIAYTMSIAMLLLSICFSLVTEPIHRTVEAKNKVTGKIYYGLSVITHARLVLWEAATEIGPMLNRLVKKMGYGVLAAAYVFIVMNSLVVPAILIDYLLISRLVEEPVQIRENVHFDYTEPRPSARVPLFAQAVSADSSRLMKVWSIPKSHRFHITATLSLPESDHNLRLGMFQVTAEILSLDGMVLARFTHPCMLRYHSRPVRYAKTAMLAVPLVLGVDVESQRLVLKLVESYEDKSSNKYPGSARIMLEPRAGFPPGAGLPEIYDAQVLVQSELPPLKSVIYRWKWTCFVWGAMVIFMLEVGLMVCCCRHLLLITPGRGTGETGGGASHVNGEFGGAESRTVEEVTLVRRPTRRKRVSFQDDLPRARAAAAGIGTRPSDIDSFVEKELQALSGTKEKLCSVQDGVTAQ